MKAYPSEVAPLLPRLARRLAPVVKALPHKFGLVAVWRLFRGRNSIHTTAAHLLRSGVDINTVRAWLGHVSLDTTNIYAEIVLEMKAKALAKCEIKNRANPGSPGARTRM